jgi:hypothetical protein
MQTERQSFYQIIRVFLACPGDLVTERSKFPRILESINNLRAHSLGLHLEAVGWERVMPSFGRPQELINSELRTADLVVVLFWNRVGFPAKRDSKKTGTIEEFELAREIYKASVKGTYGYEGHPRILAYFRKQTEPETEQAQQVLTFRRSLEEERDLFFREYSSFEEWEEMFREHAVAFIDGIVPVTVETAVANLPIRTSILNGNFLLRRVYSYQILEIEFDFDGDRNEERIKFWFQQTQHWLTLYKFDQAKRCELDWEFAEFLNTADIIELAVKDVNNDGFPELIIAAHNCGDFTTQVSVWGYRVSDGEERTLDKFVQLGLLTGQHLVYVIEGGVLNMPYGSVGLFTEYRWNGEAFAEADPG